MTKFEGRATDVLKERPDCDLCKEPAIVDGATDPGPWAYMCAVHYLMLGKGLGLGIGQVLLCEDELDQPLIRTLLS